MLAELVTVTRSGPQLPWISLNQRPTTPAARRRRRRRRRRRLVVVVVLVVAGVGTVAWWRRSHPALSPLRASIVAAAQSQVGYASDPATTYCNRFSAYWYAGTADCGNDNRSEEWCADFAAWTWRQAGASFVYALAPGDINSNSASFYVWGVDHHTWHPARSGYVAEPGDVAVYGLNLSTVTAQHVAVVTADAKGWRGPDVINGDGNRSGFSVVEVGLKQANADVHGHGGSLSGYVTPLGAS